MFRVISSVLVVVVGTSVPLLAQHSVSRRMADTVIANTQSASEGEKQLYGVSGWKYEYGTALDGMYAMYRATHDKRYLDYIKSVVDPLLTQNGEVKGFKPDAHSLDNIEMGRAVVALYRETHDKRYAHAARQMREQLDMQPRTASGGFWHKQVYLNQMWLDGAYMAEPFYASYAATFHEPKDFDDIAHQFLLMDEHMRDAKSGLMFHGWDESRQMPWADKQTGLSPEVWARAVGWYSMALVDVLDWFPKSHPQRKKLEAVLQRTAQAIVSTQNPTTGLWRDVLSHPAGEAGNFEESSASCMFVYALAKGVRQGVLASSYRQSADKGWKGITQRFVKASEDGKGVELDGVVAVSGLGGKPYRSGTYDYYIHEKVVANDLKGIGAFLLAGSEIER